MFINHIAVSYSRKISEGNYGSTDINISISAELYPEDDLVSVANELFKEARDWVIAKHKELGTVDAGEPEEFVTAAEKHNNGKISPKQAEYIQDLIKNDSELRKLVYAYLREMDRTTIFELTKVEASDLITLLRERRGGDAQ